jgi:2-hydroxymuconate-semialdehyde hydrolase
VPPVMTMPDHHALPGEDVVVDGVRLHIVRHGRAAAGRPPLLLLHGLATSSYLWRDVMRAVGHDTASIAPDLIGSGRSELALTWVDLQAQALAMLRVLDAWDIDRVVVAGHDIGGSVAVHLVSLAPDRVAGLGLVNAPVHADVWPVPAVLPLLAPGLGSAYVHGLRRAPRLAARVLRQGLGPGLVDRDVDAYLGPLLTRTGSAGLLAIARAVDLAGVEAAWDLVRVAAPPTLVLWGTHDAVFSLAYGRRVAGDLPNQAAWVPIAGAGHLLPAERPERVAEELDAFVTEVPSAAATAEGTS